MIESAAGIGRKPGDAGSSDASVEMVTSGTGGPGGSARSRPTGGGPSEPTQAVHAAVVTALTVMASAGGLAPAVGGDARLVDPATFVGCVGVASVTPALVRVDVAQRRLPNSLVGVTAIAWVASTALRAARGDVDGAATSLVGAAIVLALGVTAAVAGGLGMGDVKLGAVLTGLTSPWGVPAAVGLWGLAGVLAVGLVGVRAVRARTRHRPGRRGRPDPVGISIVPALVPFGPCLLAAFWAVVVGRSALVHVGDVVAGL